MSDLHEGSFDLSTDDGFAAALAAQVVGGETTPAETVEPVTQESVQSVVRDDQGRFTAVAPTTEETPGGAAPSATVEEKADPVAEFLARHDNDPSTALQAALREAREAQSVIGRQGNELGELRQLREEKARLEGRLEAQQAAPEALPALPTAESEDSDALEEMFANHGAQATVGWVVNNRPDLIDATIETWAVEDPVAAARFAARYETNLALAQAQQENGAQSDERVESLIRERQLGDGIAKLKASRTDWEAIAPHIGPAFEDENTPLIVKQLVVDADPAQQKQGLTLLAEIARSRALAAATGEAVQDRAAQVLVSKQAAQVATGSQRPVPAGQPVAQSEAIKTFHERIMAPDTTSVLEGLTRSKTA